MSPIDSADKRRRASGEEIPAPDGTIDAADRVQLGGEYLVEAPTGYGQVHIEAPRIHRLVRVSAY